jgi:asparagine synthase (glutamine-hydrolysing)
MCGILLGKDSINSIKHRGIEEKSIFNSNINMTMGFTRLPIQTLEGDNFSQPIQLLENRFLLFNGEIFNYNKTKFNSDIEYLIWLFNYGDWKKECKNWDGFWSIIYIDSNNKKIIAFTDPLSKKQLYYNNHFNLSSEIFPLINEQSKIDYILFSIVNKFGYNTDDRTIFTNIKRIYPNCIYTFNLEMDDRRISIENNYFTFRDSPESIYSLLEKSVESRMITKKFKISALISGGLDSSIIAYFLLKNNFDVTFYTINNSIDLEYVERFSKDFGFKYKKVDYDIDYLTDEELLDIYLKMESPIDLGSVIPQYKLFKQISDRIVLTGDGADELFGGYKRINEYDSQLSDIFQELSFYHLPRLDRSSMRSTIECRNPFLSHDLIGKAINIPYKDRINKKILKEEFKGLIPDYIINREKVPLKNKKIQEDKVKYRSRISSLLLKELRRRYENF